MPLSNKQEYDEQVTREQETKSKYGNIKEQEVLGRTNMTTFHICTLFEVTEPNLM
jgi:hypothetical protein